MDDPTKSLPWRVERRETGDLCAKVWFDVVDSAGCRICGFDDTEEHIARTVAAGSVVPELLATIREKANRQEAFAGPEYTQHSDADRQMLPKEVKS